MFFEVRDALRSFDLLLADDMDMLSGEKDCWCRLPLRWRDAALGFLE